MAFVGQDIAQMQQLESTLRKEAGNLQSIMNNIKNKVHGTDWRGSDAEKFRANWDGQHSTNLKRVADELSQVADLVKREWQQQQQASGG